MIHYSLPYFVEGRENVRAYLTLVPGADRPTAAELIRFARERVGYRAPEEVVVLDEIPLTATGKVDRHRLKELAAAGFDREA